MSTSPDWLKEQVDKIVNFIMPVMLEALRILPDSVTFGTIILASISLCLSYGVLVFTMVELMLLQRGLAMMLSSVMPLGEQSKVEKMCEPGFQYPNSMRISLLEKIGMPSTFPSPVMFFFSGILSYIICAMQQFGKEIRAFNSDIGIRTNIALGLSFTFMLAMVLFRYTYGCETISSLFVSLILGYIVGIILVFQNIGIFGRAGINILNLPIILPAKGKPMYVCAPSN
jgi:hypothetical protein